MVTAAMPEPLMGTVRRMAEPSWKLTLPVTGCVPVVETAAVKVTLAPGEAGLGEELRRVVVAAITPLIVSCSGDDVLGAL